GDNRMEPYIRFQLIYYLYGSFRMPTLSLPVFHPSFSAVCNIPSPSIHRQHIISLQATFSPDKLPTVQRFRSTNSVTLPRSSQAIRPIKASSPFRPSVGLQGRQSCLNECLWQPKSA